MEVIADIFLGAGALGAAVYCLVLARRLNRFNDLEKGIGGAVAVLSSQVDELSTALTEAQNLSRGSTETMDDLTQRAETVASRLELMMAAMHDIPEPEGTANAVAEPAPPADEPIFVRHARHQRPS